MKYAGEYRIGVMLPNRKYISDFQRQRMSGMTVHLPNRQKGAALVGRPTRSFKLRVSPGGFDLIVDCHVRLVRRTRTLLPYGAALNVAVHYLATLDLQRIANAVARFPRLELMAGKNCTTLFVGAPKAMSDVANEIAARLSQIMPEWQVPQMGELYLLSLRELLEAESDAMIAIYAQMKRHEGGARRNQNY